MEERDLWPLWVAAAAGWGSLGLSPTSSDVNTLQNPESTKPPSHPLYYCASDFSYFLFFAGIVTHDCFLYLSVGRLEIESITVTYI